MAGASSSFPPSVPSLLAAATALKGILECMDAERALSANGKEEEEEQRNNEYGFGGIEDERCKVCRNTC